LVLFVVLDDFLNNEIQEFLGKFLVEIGLVCKVGKPRDLAFFTRGVGWGQVVFGLEPTHSLRVLEPLAQCVDEDGIKPVDAFAVLFEDVRSAGNGVSHETLLCNEETERVNGIRPLPWLWQELLAVKVSRASRA
jgi:hypothetical protein